MQTFAEEEGCHLALSESLKVILERSVGSSLFRTLYGERGDVLEDVINDGDLACAFFVSTLLSMFGLLSRGVHTTVTKTLQDMLVSDWNETTHPEALAVVLWKEKMGSDGKPHFHIGICTDDTFAIEHSAVTKSPRKIRIDGLTMPDGSPRPPIAYFVNPRLRTPRT